jgi:hypothetical protein
MSFNGKFYCVKTNMEIGELPVMSQNNIKYKNLLKQSRDQMKGIGRGSTLFHDREYFNYLCTYDLHSPVHNVLDVCISITRGIGRGWALEFESFLGPVKWHRADR